MTRICILGASLGTGNMGVSALACGAVTAALRAVPGADVYFLDYSYERGRQTVELEDGRAVVELLNLRFSRKVWLRNNIVRLLLVATVSRVLPARWRRWWWDRYECLAALSNTQAVASLAGGDSFSDIYGLGRLLYVALPQILALQLGRQLIVLPQTLGPFKGFVARSVARYIIGRASMVYARDRQSLAETAELMGARSWKPGISYDMAFVMAPAAGRSVLDAVIPARADGAALVGINFSGLLAMGGYSRRNMFGLSLDYNRLIERLVTRFVAEYGVHVLLVPHVFGEHAESDVAACGALHERLSPALNGRVHLVRENLDQHEIKYVIGQCEFFIGSRMHACIAALSQSVPAVSLAYSRKFIGVMESLDMGELVIDMKSVGEQDALDRVGKLFSERRRLQEELFVRIPAVKRCVHEVFGGQRQTAETIVS